MSDRRTGGPSRPPPLRAVPGLASPPALHIGERLRAFRIRSGLSQEQAAVHAGLTRKSIARLEAARFPNPHLATLLRIMTAYKISSLEELLGTLPSIRLAEAWEEEDWYEAQQSS